MKRKNAILVAFALFCIGLTGLKAQTLKDIDGNVYKTVKIGTQVWMTGNLKTTRCNDGTAIPIVTDEKAWEALSTPAYCWYNKDAAANKDTYGALYNWFTVNTNKLCPHGWRVPSDADWTVLTTSLGGEDVASVKLRESGSKHWEKPNAGATNSSGFNALPGGYRNNHGAFADVNFFGFWWSATEYVPTAAWCRSMGCASSEVLRTFSMKKNGFSVRCVRDK
ncbi:MAG: fibrobacter succinogenes major paralogous domain-containing protein [Bacteroidales bacterium]